MTFFNTLVYLRQQRRKDDEKEKCGLPLGEYISFTDKHIDIARALFSFQVLKMSRFSLLFCETAIYKYMSCSIKNFHVYVLEDNLI